MKSFWIEEGRTEFDLMLSEDVNIDKVPTGRGRNMREIKLAKYELKPC